MNDREVFEKVIKENRYDQETRLVYADYLEENGFDDEAAEQRRCATDEWVEASRWLWNLAKRCGQTCENYGEHTRELSSAYDAYLEQHGNSGIGFNWEEYEKQDRWIDITYEDVIQAGYDTVRDGYGFVQVGSETARDLIRGIELEQFWNNWEIVTGQSVSKENRENKPFGCSC